MKISHASTDAGRAAIRDYILLKKSCDPNFRVIDIGGAVNGWTKDFVDCVVDINSADSDNNFKFDICVDQEWTRLLNFVEARGKFDYCICTHTLEDLYNPITSLKFIPRIAKQGIITMPSAKLELSRVESNHWLGYIHHRWIFDQVDGKMLIIPKLNFLESIVTPFDSEKTEISYEWTNDIDYVMFMDNYLGPTLDHVIAEYQTLIAKL